MVKFPDFLILCFLLVSLTASTSSLAGEPEAASTDSVNDVQALVPDSFSLSGKVVYLDFWASWCAPCKQSFPWMQAMLKKYEHEGLRIVTVNLDRDHSAALKFLKETEAPFYVYYDSTGDVAARFQLAGMPTSLLYARDGTLHLRHEGFSKADTLKMERTIEDLLGE